MGKKSFLFEAPLFYFLLFALQRSFFPELPSFYQVNPHPYWLGILLFSLRYGLSGGLWAGILSGGLYLGGLWIWGDRYLFENLWFYLQPGLFLLVGFSVGGVIDQLKQVIQNKEKSIQEHKETNLSFRTELAVSHQSNRNIEKQMVSQMASLVTVYHGAKKLGTLDKDQLLKGILDFFTQALSASQTAIYLKVNNSWVRTLSFGLPLEEADLPKSFGYHEGLIGKAGTENKIVSLRDWFGHDWEKSWSERSRIDALLAGPLRKGPDEVIGVFAVHDLSFLRFNSATLNLLTLLLDWAESSIAKSIYFEDLKSKSILDEVLDVYNVQYLEKRMAQEFMRSKKYYLPFSLLLVHIPNLDKVSPDGQLNFLRALSRLLISVCSKSDVITKFHEPTTPFAILAITTSLQQAEEIKTNILEAFEKLDLSNSFIGAGGPLLPLKIGIGSFRPDMTSEEVVIREAKQAA